MRERVKRRRRGWRRGGGWKRRDVGCYHVMVLYSTLIFTGAFSLVWSTGVVRDLFFSTQRMGTFSIRYSSQYFFYFFVNSMVTCSQETGVVWSFDVCFTKLIHSSRHNTAMTE